MKGGRFETLARILTSMLPVVTYDAVAQSDSYFRKGKAEAVSQLHYVARGAIAPPRNIFSYH